MLSLSQVGRETHQIRGVRNSSLSDALLQIPKRSMQPDQFHSCSVLVESLYRVSDALAVLAPSLLAQIGGRHGLPGLDFLQRLSPSQTRMAPPQPTCIPLGPSSEGLIFP